MVSETKTAKLVMTALMICLITVTTMFFKIPVPFAHGYVHLGDAMIFLSVLMLGVKRGAIAAATGSALGDVLGGFAVWAPWTLVIKGVMALITGLFILILIKQNNGWKVPVIQAAGMALSGIWMVFGYFVAEGVMYGNWMAAFVGIPWNVGQFTMGMVIALTVSSALYKTPVKRYFALTHN